MALNAYDAKAAIGVFDSGIGGLTVAAQLAQALPNEDIIYLGDTARLPYGTKSAATITRYAERAAGLLLRYPVKVLVVACNTASAHALPGLRAMTDLPVLGVVEPGARAAVAATRSGIIGLAGTESTVRSETYQAAIGRLMPSATVIAEPWPLLVALAEEGWVDHPVARLTLKTYLKPFVDGGVDTLVLGCTHYPVFKPLVTEVLRETFGRDDIALVDSAVAVTEELQELLSTNSNAAPERHGRRTFFCTDLPERFARVGTTFFPGDVSAVTAVAAVDL